MRIQKLVQALAVLQVIDHSAHKSALKMSCWHHSADK
jgi:hypothetical protein